MNSLKNSHKCSLEGEIVGFYCKRSNLYRTLNYLYGIIFFVEARSHMMNGHVLYCSPRYLCKTFHWVPVLLTLCLSLNLVIWNSSNSISLRNSLSVTRHFKIDASFDVDSQAKRYLSSCVLYTSKGTSSFNFQRKLIICGDVSENPGPWKRTLSTRFPCSLCKRNVRNNQEPSCVLRVTLGVILVALVCPRLFQLLFKESQNRLVLLFLCSATF